MYILSNVQERTSTEAFRVAVVNTGDGSDVYHPCSTTSAPPKIQTRFTMTFPDIPRERVSGIEGGKINAQLNLSRKREKERKKKRHRETERQDREKREKVKS